MRIRLANSKDVATYTALAHAAQAWLRSRGLNQYVPGAHDEYTAAIRSRVESGTLFAVQHADQAIAFFSLEASPSQWWPADKISAVYLAGIVVARSARGRGIGGVIVEWSLREAARLGFQCVRLDCHADNLWLVATTKITASHSGTRSSSIRAITDVCINETLKVPVGARREGMRNDASRIVGLNMEQTHYLERISKPP